MPNTKGKSTESINPVDQDTSRKELHFARSERDHARTERDQALLDRDTAQLARDRADIKSEFAKVEVSRLKAEGKNRDDFIATLSHDLRNPIGAIKSAIDCIKAGFDVREMTQIIEKGADQAAELIEHLLDANLIRSGHTLPVSIRHCILNEIISRCLANVPQTSRSRVKWTSSGTMFSGNWDPFALERAINNLLTNAIKYSHRDSTITIATRSAGGITEISVHNFGPPIPLKDQGRIFDGHYRSESARNSSKGGWGLGLTLVRGIAEAHGGKVAVTSNDEDGTTFTLQLPETSDAPPSPV